MYTDTNIAATLTRIVAGTVESGGSRAALLGRTATILMPTCVLVGNETALGLKRVGPETMSPEIMFLGGVIWGERKAWRCDSMERLGVRRDATCSSDMMFMVRRIYILGQYRRTALTYCTANQQTRAVRTVYLDT